MPNPKRSKRARPSRKSPAKAAMPRGLNIFEQDDFRSAVKQGDTQTVNRLRGVASDRIRFEKRTGL